MSLRLKIPPVLVCLVAGLAMWCVDRITTGVRLDFPGRGVFVILISVAGGILAGFAVVRFIRAHTTVWPEHPERATALVTIGVYRFTRNPMYLGLLLLLAAWALRLGNPVTLIVLPGFVAYMTRYQIVPEEEALTRRFGDEYTVYCERVRRWL